MIDIRSQHRTATHESRSLPVNCSQHCLQKVACSICAEKYPNQELLRRYAEGVSWKTSAMPQRAMTFLRNLFWRDIFDTSHCHTKIHRAYPTTCFASFSALQAASDRVSASVAKTVAQKSLRAHGGYVFLSLFAAPAILESRSTPRVGERANQRRRAR